MKSLSARSLILPPQAAGRWLTVAILIGAGPIAARNPDQFYDQKGTDLGFQEILKSGDIPRGRNSRQGVMGSEVTLNHELLDDGPNADRPIPENIFLHTLGNSRIRRSEFERWSRWYQEGGNTQIFRLFKDETNLRNSRPFAARIEAFSDVAWSRGEWHEWVGTYTILKPHRGAIFQARNEVNDWSVQLNLSDDGDVILNRRIGEDEVIARNQVGRPFHVRVRDNGHDYEVFLNGRKVGDGSYPRPEGRTRFRWGLYRGGRPMTHDAMILVTGAAVDPKPLRSEREETSRVEVPDESGSSPAPEGSRVEERTWTNRDGRKIRSPAVYQPQEGEFWLKVRGTWVRYPLEELSGADQLFLKEALQEETR
jgi:hypothetical protein